MNENNRVTLHGMVDGEPVHSHSSKDLDFHSIRIRVARRSGTDDVLPVLIRSDMLPGLAAGKAVTVDGSLRSYNEPSDRGRRLRLDVLAEDWTAEGGESENGIILKGTVCRAPSLRRTPSGRTICDCLIAVGRAAGRRSDYIPVIAWGDVAIDVAAMSVGDPIALEGRFQSRPYHKRYEDGTEADLVAYEVSIRRLLD